MSQVKGRTRRAKASNRTTRIPQYYVPQSSQPLGFQYQPMPLYQYMPPSAPTTCSGLSKPYYGLLPSEANSALVAPQNSGRSAGKSSRSRSRRSKSRSRSRSKSRRSRSRSRSHSRSKSRSKSRSPRASKPKKAKAKKTKKGKKMAAQPKKRAPKAKRVSITRAELEAAIKAKMPAYGKTADRTLYDKLMARMI
jgi:hypothetical protein